MHTRIALAQTSKRSSEFESSRGQIKLPKTSEQSCFQCGAKDALTWQKNTHRVRFGVDWEHHRGGNQVWQNEPASITLFSPDQARQYNLPVPTAFHTLNDVLQLPLQTVTVAVGDPRVPQENGGLVRRWNTLRLYFQDTWRLRTRKYSRSVFHRRTR